MEMSAKSIIVDIITVIQGKENVHALDNESGFGLFSLHM